MDGTYDVLRNIKNFNRAVELVSQVYFFCVICSIFININYIMIINIALCLCFLVYVEERKKKLMGALDVPNCGVVIDWKHDQIRCSERVVTISFYLQEGYGMIFFYCG